MTARANDRANPFFVQVEVAKADRDDKRILLSIGEDNPY
jgi:hypothetical protein